MKPSIVLLLFFACLLKDIQGNNDLLGKCADGIQQFTDCLKFKTIKLLDRVIVNEKPIPLAYSIYLTHNELANSSSNLKINDEAELITNSSDVDDQLNQALFRRIRLLTSVKNLQMNLDSPVESFEGRRKDRTRQQLMMFLGAGAMLLHGAMSKIAFIAGKALIIAKIALAISAVIGLRKLFTNTEHHDSTQVIYKPVENGGGWHRSINNNLDQTQAHQMAYSGQMNH